jgi:hypothetical protein
MATPRRARWSTASARMVAEQHLGGAAFLAFEQGGALRAEVQHQVGIEDRLRRRLLGEHPVENVDDAVPIVPAVECLAMSSEYVVDLAHLLCRERAESQCAAVLCHLGRIAKAGNRHRPFTARPQPGQRTLGQCTSIAPQDLAHRVNFVEPFRIWLTGREIFHPLWRIRAAHVVFGESLSGRVLTGWKARRTRAIVSTDFIPSPSVRKNERMVADPLHEGGQDWTPVAPPRGSTLHAETHSSAWRC